MKLDLIVGARPNFIKIASIINSINYYNKKGYKIVYRLIHTGQHYDKNMSDSFFSQLNIPSPHINLMVKGGTQAEQKGLIMIEYEKQLLKSEIDLFIRGLYLLSSNPCQSLVLIPSENLFGSKAGAEARAI